MSVAGVSVPVIPDAIVFALYRDQESITPTILSRTWPQFVDFLVNYVEISPCTVEEGPARCRGAECPYKSHSTFPNNPMAWSPVDITGKRQDSNVKTVTLLALDFDHLDEEKARLAVEKLSVWEHVRHTTHNCRADDFGFRVVLALTRPVDANVWHRFLKVAVEFLACTVSNRKGKTQPDPTCKNRSRFYYRPSHPKDAPFAAEHNYGKILDVDEVFAWGKANVPEEVSQVAPIPLPTTGIPWDRDGKPVQDAIDAIGQSLPPTGRHPLALALGGMLRKAGATLEDAQYIIYEGYLLGDSENPEARAATVEHTYALDAEQAMTGYTRACEIIGEDAANEIGECFLEARNTALLPKHPTVLVAPTTSTSTSTAASASTPVALEQLRDALASYTRKCAKSLERDDRIKAILCRRVLNREPLAMPGGHGDVETVLDSAEIGMGRKEAIRRVAATLPFIFPPTSWDAVVELLRPSLSRLVTAPNEDWFRVAKNAYESAQVKKLEEVAKQASATKERQETARQLVGHDGDDATPGIPPDGEGWQNQLTKNASGVVENNISNVSVFLRNHPDFCGYIRWSVVSKEIVITGGPLARYKDLPIEVVITKIEIYLLSVHGLMISHLVIERLILSIAYENSFDSIREYLESLVWDGVPRITNWLRTYCGAHEEPAEYLNLIGRRWFIAFVARGLSPGCKVDNVLVLQGEGGLGKSSVFRIIGGDWFCDTAISLGDKDSRIMAGRYWLCELAECVSLRRTGHDSLKQFFTSNKDSFRPPFAKSMQDFPRRAIFVATTNDREILVDETGNRRYWPVWCEYTPEARKRLEQDREQLLAEAVVAFKAGERWHFEYEERDIVKEVTDGSMVETVANSAVRDWWFGLTKTQRPKAVTTFEVAKIIYEERAIKNQDLVDIGHALRDLGFEARRDTSSKSKRQRRYYASEALLAAESNRRGLFVLPGGVSVAPIENSVP